MGLVKTLIHIHTNYSFDSNISPESLAALLEREEFGCVAVTDHDTIEGARHLAAISPARVIIGEEVTTRDGDLIGLFLQERVEPGMSARETALAIRQQGGLVLVPHPFIKLFGCGLGAHVREIVDLIDAVEVCNAQNIVADPDIKADRFALREGLARFVGSDSHMASAPAPCYQWLRDFRDAPDFLAALCSAQLVTGRHRLAYFAAAAYRMTRYLLGMPLPAGFGANHGASHHGSPTPRFARAVAAVA